MWMKLFDKVINLDNVEMVDLVEDKEGRRIIFHFIDRSVHSVWEDSSKDENREFDKVWNMFKNLPLLSVSCFDFQVRLGEKFDKERESEDEKVRF